MSFTFAGRGATGSLVLPATPSSREPRPADDPGAGVFLTSGRSPDHAMPPRSAAFMPTHAYSCLLIRGPSLLLPSAPRPLPQPVRSVAVRTGPGPRPGHPHGPPAWAAGAVAAPSSPPLAGLRRGEGGPGARPGRTRSVRRSRTP
ncbi:hypothetical protein SCWH03_45980 [Streptomyces pacificus]|uniref:Uncharacterized protein n=1 Tax=Streptomyces pacificus TaxID=2705029 RepID=A0A6A0AZP0_9ACTN|nr:hypothetical protein SCWH03_45980 [Streptomyces pacificus]